MGYVDNNLMNGESVLYRAKVHWIVFKWPVIWLILSFVIIAATMVVSAATIPFLLFIVSAIFAYLQYTTNEYAITNKRVIVKVGLIRRHSLEILLSKIEGISVNQGIFGRMLGYGSIVVNGTGGSREPFRSIAQPLEFRMKAQSIIGEMS